MKTLLYIIITGLMILGCKKAPKEKEKFEHKYHRSVCVKGMKYIEEITMPGNRTIYKGPIGVCDVV